LLESVHGKVGSVMDTTRTRYDIPASTLVLLFKAIDLVLLRAHKHCLWHITVYSCGNSKVAVMKMEEKPNLNWKSIVSTFGLIFFRMERDKRNEPNRERSQSIGITSCLTCGRLIVPMFSRHSGKTFDSSR